jgi:hypothetical protein
MQLPRAVKRAAMKSTAVGTSTRMRQEPSRVRPDVVAVHIHVGVERSSL